MRKRDKYSFILCTFTFTDSGKHQLCRASTINFLRSECWDDTWSFAGQYDGRHLRKKATFVHIVGWHVDLPLFTGRVYFLDYVYISENGGRGMRW